MPSLKSLMFICTVAYCLWTCPTSGSAQTAPAVLNPPIPDPLSLERNRPAWRDDTMNLSHWPISPDDSANQLDATEESVESEILACACGCGIFEVGTRSMLPTGVNHTFYVEYAYQDQNINWDGVKPASASANDDKEIRTNFVTPGVQYMFNRSWGIQAELPFANRYFQTTGGASGTDIVSLNWTTIGDARLEGIYDGFFPDQSAGVTFGFKLPTGNFRHNDRFDDIDRDTEIGTGSTDILLGGFYRNNLTADGTLAWFAQTTLDVPVLTQDQYRPGVESDSALGVYLNGLKIGHIGVTPIMQVLNGLRGQDSGDNAAHPVASGYERVLLSPGVEFDLHPFMLYADVEFPVYAHVTGDQLVGADLFKIILSYEF